MDSPLVNICQLMTTLKLIGTLNYAARTADVSIQKIALVFALFNIVTAFQAGLFIPMSSSLVGSIQEGNNAGLLSNKTNASQQVVSINEFTGTTVARLNAAAAAIRSRGSGTLLIPRGSYSLDSFELATPVSLPANIIVEGEGSTLTIAGKGVIGSVFRSENTSNVTIRNLRVIGNGQAVADATSGAFFNYVHTASGSGAENIQIENVRLQNFKAERWVSILNSHVSSEVRGVKIRNLSGISRPGNNLGTASIGISSTLLMVYGVTASINDVEIDRLYAEARYIKTGITIFHKVKNVRINSPIILNAGQTGTANDMGSYAINAYGDVGDLSDVSINDAVLTSPRSAGIYIRGVTNVVINNPSITGQSDTTTGTLPKGAIVGNGSRDIKISGGTLTGNVYDLSFVADTRSTKFNLLVTGLKTRSASLSSILLHPATGAGSPDGVSFVDCDIKATGRALQIANTVVRNFKNVTFSRGFWVSTGSTAFELHTADQFTLSNYRIENMTIGASSIGIAADSPAAIGTGGLTITNVVIYDSGRNSMKYGILARNLPSLHIDNVTVRDMRTGFATLTAGAKGTIKGLRIENVANGFGPK